MFPAQPASGQLPLQLSRHLTSPPPETSSPPAPSQGHVIHPSPGGHSEVLGSPPRFPCSCIPNPWPPSLPPSCLPCTLTKATGVLTLLSTSSDQAPSYPTQPRSNHIPSQSSPRPRGSSTGSGSNSPGSEIPGSASYLLGCFGKSLGLCGPSFPYV